MSTIKRINLLPNSRARNKEWTRDHLLLLLAIPLIGFMVVDYTSRSQQISKEKKAFEQVQRNQKQLREQLAAMNIDLSNLQATSGLEAFEINPANKIVWTEPFQELSQIIPDGVWLSKLNAHYDKDGIRQIHLSGFAESDSMVSEFFGRLEKSLHLRRVLMSFAERQKDTAPTLYEFEFKIPLQNRPPKLESAEAKVGVK